MTQTRKCLALFLVIFYLACSSLICGNNIVWAIQPENTWASKAELPQTDMGIMAASVNGTIYVMGGSVNLEFNPATNNWTSKTPMLTPRKGVGMAIYQNKIYTMGGSTGWTQETGTIQSNVNEVYDPSTDTWETKKPMPTNESYVGAGVMDGKIHLIGGGIHYVYNVALDAWSTEEALSPPNYGYGSATTVFDNKIYVINGNQTQIYDPTNKQWSLGASMPTLVSYAGVCSTTGEMATKRIYVIGGTTGKDGMFTAGSDLVQVYDPIANTWTLGDPMPTGRLGLTVAVANDKIYAFAGQMAMVFSGPLKVNEEYTPFGYGTPDASYIEPTSTPTPTVPEISYCAFALLTAVMVVILAVVFLKKTIMSN